MIVMLCFCALAGIFGSVHRQLDAGRVGGVEMAISVLLSIVFAVGVGILRQACFITLNIAFVFALLMHLVAIWVYNRMG